MCRSKRNYLPSSSCAHAASDSGVDGPWYGLMSPVSILLNWIVSYSISASVGAGTRLLEPEGILLKCYSQSKPSKIFADLCETTYIAMYVRMKTRCTSQGNIVRNFDFWRSFSYWNRSSVFSESWMNELVSVTSSTRLEYLWCLLVMGAILGLLC
jgi:hypothetical protein